MTSISLTASTAPTGDDASTRPAGAAAGVF